MFQVTTFTDPSFLAICGAIAANLWALGGDYPWLLFGGYILGLMLLGGTAIFLIDRKPGNPGRLRRYLASVESWLHLTAVTGHIGRSWLWRHGDRAMIAVAVCAFLTGASYIGWRVTIAGDTVDSERIALINSSEPLIDHTGKPVSESAFRGKLTLISFGYTFCTDACPITLNTMSLTLDALGARTTDIVAAFVTVDPARDTVEVLGAFMKNFHPNIVGMTGSAARIRALARNYQIYYAKTGDDESDIDYPMEHSAWIYLVGRDGRILQRFPHTATPEQISDRIRLEFATPIS